MLLAACAIDDCGEVPASCLTASAWVIVPHSYRLSISRTRCRSQIGELLAVFLSSSAKEYEECLGDRRLPIRQVR